MTSSTTRAFVAKKPFATASAFMAKTNQLLSTMASLRLLLVMFLTLTVTTNAWADYTITFKTNGNTDGSSAQTSIANLISSGGEYVSTISANKAYNGKNGYGVKLGSSSDVGNVSMNLTSNGNNIGQIKASKLIVNAAYYKTGPKLKVTVTYTDNTTVSQSLSLTASIAAYDVTLSSTKTLKSIKIESVAGSSEERVYCHSIQVVAAAAVTTYTVTYDLNGGTGTTPTQADVAAGGTFILAASSGFSKAGYSFAGWNDGTTTYNAGATYTMPAKAVTLKAQWTALPKYTVTWEVNGDQSVTTQVTEGSKPTFPATPSSCDATSNTFYGWATATWDGKIDNISEKTIYTSANNMPAVNGAVTYYAVFAKEETSGSGTAGWSKVTSTDDLEAGAIYAISSAATAGTYLSTYANGNNFPGSESVICPLILGGSADAWTFQINDGSTYDKRYLTATNTTSNNYLKAVASVDKYSYFSVSFSNGAAVITCTGKDTRNILRKNSSSSLFACYSSGQSAVYLQKYSTGSTTTYSDYITTCSKEPSYSVTLQSGLSCVTNGSATVELNATELTNFKAATRDGFTCSGYWSAPSGGVQVLNADGTFAATIVQGYITDGKWTKKENVTLTPHWECSNTMILSVGTQSGGTYSLSETSLETCDCENDKRQVTITATPNSGYSVTDISYSGDGTATKVSGPTVNGENTEWVYQFNQGDNGNGTFTVTFTTIPTYTITLDAGSGTCTTPSLSGINNAIVELPAATPSDACETEGWTFAGWATEKVEETNTVPDPLYATGDEYTIKGSTSLYAVYTQTESGGGGSEYTQLAWGTPINAGKYLISTGTITVTGQSGNKLSELAVTPYTPSTTKKTDYEFTISEPDNEGYFTIKLPDNINWVGWSTKTSTTLSQSEPSEENYLWKYTSNGIQNKSAQTRYLQVNGSEDAAKVYTKDNPETNWKRTYLYSFSGGSTTIYNSDPECCQQPKNPLTITADQTELVKNGVVQLTATGGNGRPITWSTTSGSLTNQSNTGATLTINDVATTQTITVTASQEKNDDDEPICEQEATIDITVKTQWTIIFQTNDNGVINSNSIIVTDGESYTMPDISDEYICTGSTSFAGWRSTDSNAAPEQIAGNAVKATANTTWYAVWITTNDYTTETRDKYELVTTSQQITQNDVVIITYANGGVALGQMTEEDLYGSPVAVDFSADKSYLTFAEGTAVMPLKVLWWDDKDDDFDGWYFEDNANTGHYLTYSGEQGGTLYYETDWWMWDIEITLQKNATISDTEEGYEKYNLQYNSSNSRFAFYTSSQKKVQLYRKNGTINIQIPSEPTYTTNNTACTRGAVISAEDGKWVTATNGQKVRTAINVTARGFKSAATLSATSNNPNFVVSLPNPSISASTVVNTTLNVEYTPTTAETTETAQITLTAGETTQTITVNGRSLPDEFVIVTLRNDKYYALPANMQSGANQYSGIEVAPNNSLTQIPVAPSTTIYTLRSVAEARYEAAGNCVRLVGNSNKCLWGNAATTNTTIQNWTTLGATNGSNYEWLLTTSDGELYTIANPAHPDYSTGRLLAMSGTQFGLYKNETVFYILPVGCSSMPANVQVSPRRVDATFSWESNANSTTIDVYTNEAMTSGNISKTASSSPFFFDGLKELTQYWYKITPDGNATCAVTGSFTTTGPTIDVVEWKEDQVVIFVDKDENVNPLVIIDGEVEHNTGSTSATDLFFSKYFEAQGTAKLLAIYNGTTNALPLEEITILHRSKDKNTPLSLASFGKTPGWIQPSEEIILYNVDDREEVMDCAEADPTFPSWNNVEDKNLEFSGKGTIRLFRGNTCIDIIGAMNSIDDMNNMDASPIEGSEKPEFGDNTGFSTSTGDNYATDAEEKNYALSTNRCLLVRKPSVTSGTNAITNNIGDFKTLGNDFTGIANEWAGLQIPNGPSNNQFQYTCEGFKEVGSFDYNKYYKEYNNIDGDTYLESYDHDDETHEYTIDIENLAQYSCLNIRFQLKQDDQILTEAPVQVPIIVNGDKTTADAIFNQIVKDNTAMSIERCATCNVVVLNNAKLTKATDGTTNDVPTIGNLKVYPGGSVIVPDGTNYTINSLALRRQEDEIAMANIQGTLNIKQTKSVYLDVRIDPTNWHYISLPHDCRVGDIFFTDGTPAILNTDYLLGWYDGAYRAEHKTGGWTYITDNDYILKQGLGYIIALPGTDKIKRELRFPMANETITEDKEDKEIGGLYAYGGDKSDQELGPNHKGWNMIGNPYLYTYTADIVKEPLQMGTLSKYGDPWDGSWERTGDARYIVEPIDNGWSGYRQTTITNLKPFTSYFIQVGGTKISDGYTTVTPETEQMIEFRANSVARAGAPRRAQTNNTLEDNHPVWYGIELIAPNNEKDNTTLLISNDFTDGYDMMDDLVKMRGDYYQYYNYPVLASRNDEGEMAFNALPDNSAARVGVPLNYYAAVAGTYTITTDGRFDLEEVKSAILYDATTAQECDLLLEDYTFTTAKGNNSDRFTLFVTVERKKAPSIPTGKDNLLTDGQLSLITIDRTLVLSGLTDKADIYVYDMTGKLIIGAHNSGDNGIWRTSVPTSGVYFVRVNGKTEAQTIKAVVK